jgi:predicted dehydrogenase
VTTTTTTTAAAARQPTHAAASVVVVGSGRMGEIRASLLRANPRFHLLGIVDTHLPGAKRLADKYGVKTNKRRG